MPLKGARSENDSGPPSGFPDHATLLLGAAPEQFEALWQSDRSANLQTGAACGIIHDRTIKDRLSRGDDDFADPGHLSSGSNPCVSARMNHPNPCFR
jgi:hypothetical protein